MLFGLENVWSTFQRAMYIVMATVKGQFALVYLEDVVIFPGLVAEHLNHLVMVWGLFPRPSMYINLKNCFVSGNCIYCFGTPYPA